MKLSRLISLILILSVSALSGCGGGGGDEGPVADTNAPAAVALTASKNVALADGSDAVTIQAEVKKADGAAVADGTPVTFSVPSNSGSLSAATAVTSNGHASVTVKRGPVSGAKNQTVSVTAAAGGASGSKDVKFINQPSSASVSVAFKQPVTNLGGLQLNLNNTAGATFDNAGQPISSVNTAAGSLVAGNFNAAANSNAIAMVNAAGCNTGTAPIIQATYSVSAGLPEFSVAPALSATDFNIAAITAVSAADMVVTTTFDTE